MDASAAESSVRSARAASTARAASREQRLDARSPDGEFTEPLDQQRVLGGRLDSRSRTRAGSWCARTRRPPRALRRRCPTSIAACSNWATGAVELGALEGEVVREDPVGRDGHRRPAGRCRWRSSAGPCRPSRRRPSGPGRPRGHVRDVQVVVLGPGEHRDPVGEQGARGVVLDAVQDVRAVGPARQSRVRMSWTCLVPASDWALPNRRPARTSPKKNSRCSGGALTADHVDVDEVALRDLGEARRRRRRAAGRSRPGSPGVTSAPPYSAGTVTASSPEAESRSSSARGQAAFGVPLGGPGAELVGQRARRRSGPRRRRR